MNRITLLALFGATAFAQVVIPAGTTFRVRTAEFIDVDSTKAGMKFRGTLDDPPPESQSPGSNRSCATGSSSHL